jgi:hypothetical protein
MPSPRVNVYLGQRLKEAWQAHCRDSGEKPGMALRHLLEETLKNAAGATAPSTPTPLGRPERGQKSRLHLRLTASELALVQELAEREGCSPQTWVVNLVRAMLTRQPQVGMREFELLGESNYQLLAIGRNLNQIAKHLNEGEPENVTLKEIRELREQIDAHTEVVSQALAASVERWSVR